MSKGSFSAETSVISSLIIFISLVLNPEFGNVLYWGLPSLVFGTIHGYRFNFDKTYDSRRKVGTVCMQVLVPLPFLITVMLWNSGTIGVGAGLFITYVVGFIFYFIGKA